MPAPLPSGCGGDLRRWRGAAAPEGSGCWARGLARRGATAGACGAWRALRRRRGDRSARGARPRPQRHPQSGDPRGVCGAGPVSRPPLDPPRAWRPLPGSPSLLRLRAGQDPHVAAPPVPSIPVPAWLTLGLSQAPRPILGGKSCFLQPEASQCHREGKEGRPRKAGSQGPTRRVRISAGPSAVPSGNASRRFPLAGAPRHAEQCDPKRTSRVRQAGIGGVEGGRR